MDLKLSVLHRAWKRQEIAHVERNEFWELGLGSSKATLACQPALLCAVLALG